MVVMEMMEYTKGVKALKLSVDELIKMNNPVTTIYPSDNTHYSYTTPWIFFIVLLSMLTIFALYWIFILIVRTLTRKSSIC